ncbi:MAG: FAD-binding oxidoreductase [Candidatus Heimdallarchaeota archaeon]|nr:MAG: FAD-binding oxidoreductase [Candidatus Heimdallarchaeota archaeon]
MRTYDRLFMWFVFFLVTISIYFFALPELHPNQEYQFVGVALVILSFSILLIYFLTLKKQRKQIHIKLNTFQDAGMIVFRKKYERLLYSRDIGDIPKIIRLLFNLNCLAVLQPKDISELRSIIDLCEQYRIPLIPRGAGTSGYGGTVPIKNGIIVLLTNFDKVIAIDEENHTVEVECGITWENLRKHLETINLTLKSYPSSGPSSTVGGWVAQGGYGVGSTKFGSVNNSVVSTVILGTQGKEVQVNPDVFIGSCGKLGILWKVTLKVRNLSDMVHRAVSSFHQDQLLKAISAYQDLQPFFLRFDDHQNLLWKSSGNISAWQSQEYAGGIISMSFLEKNWHNGDFDEVTQKFELSELSDDLSKRFWDERFQTIRLKREGPSLIVAEVLVPTIHLHEIIEALTKRYERKLYAIELVSASDGFCILFVWFPADIRQKSVPIFGSLPYTFHWIRTFDIIQIARHWKGKPYSSGIWFSPYSSLIFQKQLSKMKLLEKEIDPYGIFNPGKVWGAWIPRFFPILPFWITIRIGAPIASLLYRIVPKRFR